MKIFLNKTVFEAAKERIGFIIDEFENFGVWFSGGKDSTVTMELVLQVAEEKGRLPVPVCFVDQEAEWNAVVEYTRKVMADPRVKPMWIQVPIKLFNATSMDDPWLNCWADGEEWMRDKEPVAIKENVYGTDRFGQMFNKILRHHYGDEPAAFFGGVRAEESPARLSALTGQATYKTVTWGKRLDARRNQYTFYPLYDWSFRDIWKSIHDNGWSYNRIYDEFYRHGITWMKMRVSNLHHETAIDQLFYLQEMEGETWDKLTKRLKGINQTRHMAKKDMFVVNELPFMFSDWKEYRDYLVDKLVQTQERKDIFTKKFAWMDREFDDLADGYIEERHRMEVHTVLANDYFFSKLNNWLTRPQAINYVKHKKGRPVNWTRGEAALKYIKKEQRG